MSETEARVCSREGVIKTVYMCKTDWEWHVGHDAFPSKVYTSEKSIREQSKCVEQCGIVAVEMRLVRVVQEENFDNAKEAPTDV